MQDNKEIYDEYVFARHAIQMEDARVVKCNFENKIPFSTNFPFNIKFSLRHSVRYVAEDLCYGTLYSKLYVVSKQKSEIIMPIEIVCMGRFRLEQKDMSKEEFIKQVKLQTVPQLLPYLRGALSSLSAMALPVSLMLPTMDVIQSIRKNREARDDGNH
jgi:preprotein translocase subunit SecB